MTKVGTKAEKIDDKMALWERVRAPDKTHLKAFDNGKFKGTAIRPAYLAMLATREFGPVGLGWGWSIDDERIESAGSISLHIVRVTLWYLLDGKRGELTHFGHTVLVSKNGHVDDEAPKKSLTDAIGKCLSLLGFAADVHLGLWDGAKYGGPDDDRREQRQKEIEKPRKESAAALMARFVEAVDNKTTTTALVELLDAAQEDLSGLKPEHRGMCAKLVEVRGLEIEKKPITEDLAKTAAKLRSLPKPVAI